VDILLSPVEVRILGALIEKEITTPQHYPLSLNALTNACNQKSNRDPVMNLDEKTVERTLAELRFKKLVWKTTAAGDRVTKYKHSISAIHEFTQKEVNVLAELFLRGPQTLGELRTHTARFGEFEDLEEVENVLQNLIDAEQGPFIIKLPREIGRRENRYAHLFCGEVKVATERLEPLQESEIEKLQTENKRMEVLEQEIALLKDELNNLKEEFISFKKQFV
jgi:hypothetical protein